MRSITLELLRHGPAHNQLLSPLTPYMALCENHGAVTLHIPFEHNQFLHRLKEMRYQGLDFSRSYYLADVSRLLGDILGLIPGLTAESNKGGDSENPITQIRLILSASELALLPFEMSLAPNGLPGAGQHLLLQPQMPICLTREIRRTGNEDFTWPLVPRILFVSASPGEIGVPFQEHLNALKTKISPWLKFFHPTDDDARVRRTEEYLVVLENASIEDIENLCSQYREKPFTHIHILAHGAERKGDYDSRFYLEFHKSADRKSIDYISGSRLAVALRPAMKPDCHPLARPAVVSLASCDGSNVGSVLGAGASIAHSLHEAGIPLVIASQFPLSFAGSIKMVEYLFEDLMWGIDPRLIIHDLRRKLYAQFPENHDWASLTAYLSLPSDYERQLPEIQIQRALQSINAAMNHADEATKHLSPRMKNMLSQETAGISVEEITVLLNNAKKRINESKKKLEALLDRWPQKMDRINGFLASTEKRHAEILYSASLKPGNSINDVDSVSSFDLLRKSRNYYWDAFLANRSQNWAIVQYLSLTLVMNLSEKFPEHSFAEQQSGSLPELAGYDKTEKKLAALWTMARLLASYDLYSADKQLSIWAHSSLIELYILAPLIPNLPDIPENLLELAQGHTDSLIDISGRKSLTVYSTRRQVLRYVEWFSQISRVEPAAYLADKIFERFPQEAEDAWR